VRVHLHHTPPVISQIEIHAAASLGDTKRNGQSVSRKCARLRQRERLGHSLCRGRLPRRLVVSTCEPATKPLRPYWPSLDMLTDDERRVRATIEGVEQSGAFYDRGEPLGSAYSIYSPP
jgi:hypothetical protein